MVLLPHWPLTLITWAPLGRGELTEEVVEVALEALVDVLVVVLGLVLVELLGVGVAEDVVVGSSGASPHRPY